MQANLGAKNHACIMPDADKDSVVAAMTAAAFGAAGQRCMAISVGVFVGESKEWIPDIIAEAKKLKVGAGINSDTDIPPVITPEAKARIESLITESEAQGASVPLDGRNIDVEGYSNGNVGATALDDCTTEMAGYTEIFGPVREPFYVVRLRDAADADAVAARNPAGRDVFAPADRVAFVRPEELSSRGCDASNVYDEELPDHQQEFSDDEDAQAARALAKKRGRDGGAAPPPPGAVYEGPPPPP